MKYAIASLGDSFVLVTADGNPVPHKDEPEWTFHILPKLYLPNFSDIEPPETIKLKVSSPELGDAARPNTEIVVRQPYPNPDYYVAGTTERKMGWEVKLTSDFTTIHLVFDWEFSADGCLIWDTGIYKLTHELTFKLQQTSQGHVYSMDMPFRKNQFSSSISKPIAVLDECDFEPFIRDGDPNQFYSFQYIPEPDLENRILIKQSLTLPSCAWSNIIIDSIEELRLLRDVKPVTNFTTFLSEHRSNACCEITAKVVHQAISLAREVPFRQGSHYFSNYEAHPAMICLSQWWNQNAPNESHRCAAHAKIWVRVEDNDEYWCGYHEEPNRPVSSGIASKDIVSRWGDFLLLEFAKSRDTIYQEDGYAVLPDVSGGCFEMTGEEPEECHPAWYGLVALEQFPSRFPAAWKALCEAIEG